MKNYKISGFADEICDNFEDQLKHLTELEIKYIEVRGINKKNISSLTADEMIEARRLLDLYGIKVSAIGSPIGKIKITDDFDKHINVFMNVIKAAQILGTKNIRMFSFYIPEEDRKDGNFKKHREAVFSKINTLLDIADKHGVVLCHENERDIYGDSPEGCLDLMEEFYPRMKFVFDPANFIVSGYEPYPYAFEMLKKYIEYVHIKDAKPAGGNGEIYPAGGGNGKIPEMLKDLYDNGFDGYLSIEPHLSVFSGIDQLEHGENKLVKNKFASKEEAFDAAHTGLLKCLRNTISIAAEYLTFENESQKLLDEKTVELLIDTFDKVYADICDFFNNGKLLKVVYLVDPNYDGIAATMGTKVICNPEWFVKYPWDIDCMTHELIHVAQEYGYRGCPGWVCEGLADYGRAKFGLYHKESNWSMPKYNEKQHYTNAYRVTAAFFVWIEETFDADFARKLNNTIKEGKYTDNYFFEATGKTVDELWQMYADASK